MNHMDRTRVGRIGAMLAAFLVLGACAAMAPSPEEEVGLRAQQRWDALLAGRYEEAYGYLSPGYRSSVPLRAYQRMRATQRINWRSAQIEESSCSESSCKVRIKIDYSVYGALPGVREFKSFGVVEEDWIRVDGTWYMVPEK